MYVLLLLHKHSYRALKIGLVATGFLATGYSSIGLADDKTVFDILKLPTGASVTLPAPATTSVPIDAPFQLGSTDLPQTVSLRIFGMVGQGEMKVAVFDSGASRVQYLKASPGVAAVYTFRRLGHITIKPSTPKGLKTWQGSTAKLQIESDKPLTIAR